MTDSSDDSNRFLLHIVTQYLSERPFFYSFIRPQEAAFFYRYRSYIKPPILDYGCGDGFFTTLAFPEHNIDIGLDIPGSRVERAQKSPVYNSIVEYEGDVIPSRSASVNTVVSNCVFEHLPDLDEKLSEIARILKPGGCCLTTVMTQHWESSLLGAKLFGKPYQNYFRNKQQHINLHSPDGWQSRFHQAGLEPLLLHGYLGRQACALFETCHFLSVPNLICFHLFGKWVPHSNWHKPMRLGRKIRSVIRKDLDTKPRSAAALFFILQKKPNPPSVNFTQRGAGGRSAVYDPEAPT